MDIWDEKSGDYKLFYVKNCMFERRSDKICLETAPPLQTLPSGPQGARYVRVMWYVLRTWFDLLCGGVVVAQWNQEQHDDDNTQHWDQAALSHRWRRYHTLDTHSNNEAITDNRLHLSPPLSLHRCATHHGPRKWMLSQDYNLVLSWAEEVRGQEGSAPSNTSGGHSCYWPLLENAC